jgi:hypothetical protein
MLLRTCIVMNKKDSTNPLLARLLMISKSTDIVFGVNKKSPLHLLASGDITCVATFFIYTNIPASFAHSSASSSDAICCRGWNSVN